MNLKNRTAHFFMKAFGGSVFSIKLAVFYEQTLYLTALKENVSEIYKTNLQLPRRDIHWK